MSINVSRIVAAASAVVLVAGTAACASSSQAAGSDDGRTTVRYGIYEPGLDSGFLLMAQEKDLWAKYGVDVEVVTFKSASEVYPAFMAGQVDVIQANPSEALLAAQKGAEISFIGSTMPGLNYALYANARFDSIQDLQGATLGISAPTALPAVVAKAMLMAEGVDPESVQETKAGGSPDRYTAVVNGVLDAASSPTDWAGRAESDGIKVLGLAKDVVPDYPRYALIAHDSYLDAHPDGAVGLIEGLVEGIRYASEHKDEAMALSAKTLSVDVNDPTVEFTYDEFRDGGYLATNGEIPVEQIRYLADLQVQLGIATEAMDVDAMVDDTYRQEAIADLGEVPTTYYGATHGN